MRITMIAAGSRGDVQPYVALAKGLQEAGHDVRFATFRIFEDLVRDQGLETFTVDVDPRQMLLNHAVGEFGNNPVRLLRWHERQYRDLMELSFRWALEAAQGADCLLNSSLAFAGFHVAEKLALPAFMMALQPTTPTRAFHSFTVPPPPAWWPGKGLYNFCSFKLFNQAFFAVLLPSVNASRASVLGLPPLSLRDYWPLDTGPTPILYGYSPSVLPKPPDWGDYRHVTGYWFLDQAQGFTPSADLVAFLEAGPPPVYVGFGSMVDHEADAMTRLVVEALDQAGQRAILLGGWSNLGTVALPDTIFRLDSVPHDWLFPRVAAVVHHGGAGTTAAGLRAGVPTVIVPFFADQPFWGHRVAALGVGPEPILRKHLTAERLAYAIRVAVAHEPIRQRADGLGERIRAEDGVARAVEVIERYLG